MRFVVTNRRGRAADVFAWYHQRGQAENFHPCHAFRANAF